MDRPASGSFYTLYNTVEGNILNAVRETPYLEHLLHFWLPSLEFGHDLLPRDRYVPLARVGGSFCAGHAGEQDKVEKLPA